MRYHVGSPSKAGWFLILMSVALLCSFMPEHWTRWRHGPAQILSLFSGRVWSATRGGPTGDGAALTREQIAELQVRCEEQERLLIQQGLRLNDLEQRVEVGGQIIGVVRDRRSSALHAHILKFDTDRRRQTITIDVGSADGVRAQSPVMAGVAKEDIARDETMRSTVFRQWLIGRVDSVSAFTSEVLLTTDVASHLAVVPVRVLADGTPQIAGDESLFLAGNGDARGLTVQRCPLDYFAQGFRYLVTSQTPGTPDHLFVGEIVGAQQSLEQALLLDLPARTPGDVRKLRYVFVLGEFASAK